MTLLSKTLCLWSQIPDADADADADAASLINCINSHFNVYPKFHIQHSIRSCHCVFHSYITIVHNEWTNTWWKYCSQPTLCNQLIIPYPPVQLIWVGWFTIHQLTFTSMMTVTALINTHGKKEHLTRPISTRVGLNASYIGTNQPVSQ
jgi:hypothetical protein